MYRSIVVLAGKFDPVHEGHIALFCNAAAKYDKIIVGVLSDHALVDKKQKVFMPLASRKAILKAISYIDIVVDFDDSDGSNIELLREVRHTFPGSLITYGIGKPKNADRCPEFTFCMYNKILIDDSLGSSNNTTSSTKLLQRWCSKKTTKSTYIL